MKKSILYSDLKENFLKDIGFDYKNPKTRAQHEEKLTDIRRGVNFSIGDYTFTFKKREEQYSSSTIHFIYAIKKNSSDWEYGDNVLICWVGENNSYQEEEVHGYIDNFEFVQPEQIEIHKRIDNTNAVPIITSATKSTQNEDDVDKLIKILKAQNVHSTLVDSVRVRLNNLINDYASRGKVNDRHRGLLQHKISINNVILTKEKDALKLEVIINDDKYEKFLISFKKNHDENALVYWEQTIERPVYF